MLKRFVLFAVLVFAVVAYGGIAHAATYEYKFPINCTDNTGSARTYLPVMLGFGGQQLVDAGKVDSDGLDTNMQIGSTDAKYMMSTANVTAVIPSLPANGKQTLDFYTGYSPEQTEFSIIPGVDGYITTSDHSTIELWDNFEISMSGWVDTGIIGSAFQNAYVNKGTDFTIYNNQTGNITAAIEGMFLDFERTNSDYVTISDEDEFSFTTSDNVDQPFSVSAWVNFEDATGSTIIAKAKDATHWEWQFSTTAGDSLLLKVANIDTSGYVGRTSGAVTSNESTWVHYCGTYDGSETSAGINLYIDGVDSDTADNEALPYNGMTPGDSPLEIGSIYSHTVTFMDGKMGEVKVFNIELSPAQVLEEYNGGYNSNVVGRWTLAEGTGLPQDSSGNDFNATANTADWIVGTSVTASSVSSGEHDVLTAMDSPFLSLGIDQTSPITPVSDNLVFNAPMWQTGLDADPFTTIDDSETSVDVQEAVWSLNEGYTFDGVDDYLEVSHNATQLLTTGGTIEVWAKPNSAGEGIGSESGFILDKSSNLGAADGFLIGLRADAPTNCVFGRIDSGTKRLSATNSVIYGDGNWYHVVVTWDDTGYVTLYVNGSQSGTPGISADPAGITTANAMRIGNRATATDRTFDGLIGEVRIYDSEFTPAQVLQNYNATKSKYTSGDIYTYSTLDSVPDNANDYLFNTGDVMSYTDNISFTINGTQQLYYAPNEMLDGAVLPDRAGTSQDGTIIWGSNTGLEIVFGAMESSAGAVATANQTGGFTMPTATMPSTWFAAGENLANLPFYDSFNDVSSQTGQPVQTIYFLAIIGVAFGAFFLVTINTRAALLGVLGFNIVLFIGSSMTIVPMWIPFSVLIVQIGIMYLYRQVAY